MGPGRESLWRGRISTVDLLAPTTSDWLLIILKNISFSFLQNKLCQTGGQLYWAFPFPSVRFPWSGICFGTSIVLKIVNNSTNTNSIKIFAQIWNHWNFRIFWCRLEILQILSILCVVSLWVYLNSLYWGFEGSKPVPEVKNYRFVLKRVLRSFVNTYPRFLIGFRKG